MKEYIVDSCIFVAFLFKEKSFLAVEEILNRAFAGEIKLIVSPIILGEIYFTAVRQIPKIEVSEFLEDIKQNYNLEITTISFADCMAAAEYKTSGEIAYFDCFNLVLAQKYPKAEILTLDSEYQKFAQEFNVRFL